jgi:O-antigen ligase
MRLKKFMTPVSLALLILIYPLKGGDTLALGFLPTGVALAFFTFAFLRHPRNGFTFKVPDLAVAGYTVLIIGSALHAGSSDISIRYLVQILALSIYPFFVIRLTGLSAIEAARFFAIFPVMSLIAAASMVTIVGYDSIFSYSGFRLGTENLNPVGVGYVFGMSAIITIAALSARLCGYFIGLTSLTVSTVLLVYCASRGSMLALSIAVILLLLIKRRSKYRTLLALSTLLIAGYFAFGGLVDTMVVDRFRNPIDSVSAQLRFKSWSEAFDMFNQRPILGYGLGAFEERYGEYAHNSVLEHLANGGLLLTIPYLLIGTWLTVQIFHQRSGPINELALFLSLVGTYAFSVRLLSFSMANTKEIFILIAMVLSLSEGGQHWRHMKKRKPVEPKTLLVPEPLGLVRGTTNAKNLKVEPRSDGDV